MIQAARDTRRENPANMKPAETAEKEPAVSPEVKKTEPVTGVVTDCLKLNLRNGPSIDADVITEISALSEVLVDMDASTEEFYKVSITAGIEGFCMRKYIAVRK